jgi:hypothetical protein
VTAQPDYDIPCEHCKVRIGSHTFEGYGQCMTAAGHDFHEPFHEVEAHEHNEQQFLAGSLRVAAGTLPSPLGVIPVVQFVFAGPDPEGGTQETHPIILVMDAGGLRRAVTLVESAVISAIERASHA